MDHVAYLRKLGFKRITLKTGAYDNEALAMAIRFSADGELDLLTIDGSGGGTGQGLGQGSQSQLRFLPAQHTDFAFAVWAEATGFLGSTVLLLAYALLLGRIGKVALTSGSRHGMILSVLVGAWLFFQIVVNLGMVLGWLPTAGVTLPLFSYGGSSLISTCAALGIVQSVWRYRLVNQ